MAKRAQAAGPSVARKRPRLAESTPASKPASRARAQAAPAKNAESAAASRDSKDGTTFYVAAGSYERLLYGLEGSANLAEDGSLSIDLQPIFQFPAHLSCIKTVAFSPAASSGRLMLVTGGTDESIKVWDVGRRKEVGNLVVHSGIITRVLFASDKHFVSASTDNTLALLHTKDWSLFRTFKGHKGRINHVDVHPSGRVALSVASDRTLRMWDLLGSTKAPRGKEGSSSTKLGAEGDVVRWDADGVLFGVITGSEARIFRANFSPVCALTHKMRLQDLHFCQGGEKKLLLLASEDGKIYVYDATTWANSDEPETPILAELVGHSRRVKALSVFRIGADSSSGSNVVVSAASDGFIRFHGLAGLSKASSTRTVDAAAVYDTKGSRLVCLDARAVSVPASSNSVDLEVGQEAVVNESAAEAEFEDGVEGEDGEDEGEFTGFD